MLWQKFQAGFLHKWTLIFRNITNNYKMLLFYNDTLLSYLFLNLSMWNSLQSLFKWLCYSDMESIYSNLPQYCINHVFVLTRGGADGGRCSEVEVYLCGLYWSTCYYINWLHYECTFIYDGIYYKIYKRNRYSFFINCKIPTNDLHEKYPF